MAEQPAWAEVALSVYELHGAAAINLLTSASGFGGAYHVGVEVYGLEWSFGGSDVGTGVYMVHIGTSTLGNLRSREVLGRTRKSPEEVFEILGDMRKKWRGAQYHLLARNCVHFCKTFTQRLGFARTPDWINTLADTGAALTGAQADEGVLIAEEENLDQYDDDDLEDFANEGDQIALLELAWRRSQEYTFELVEKATLDSKFEDLLVEFRFIVAGRESLRLQPVANRLMRDERLEQAIAESVAGALGLQWDPDSYVWSCPVTVGKLQASAGYRTSATCRVTGADYMRQIQRKANREDFPAKFKKAMSSAASWDNQQKSLMDTMQVDTIPGQASLHTRVLQPRGAKANIGAGAVLFPPKDFKTPSSLQGTLSKLQELRATVQEQGSVHRTLKMMTSKPQSFWWAP
jgi:hypothetical protein